MTSTPNVELIPAVSSSNEGLRRIRIARFGWAILTYTFFVILFGAVVRITGSGAGCGQHWPTCQGEIVHLPRTVATAIELSHRLTSGLSLVFVVGLGIAVFRTFPIGHVTRRVAITSIALMLTESLVGAALVLLRLVGQNSSVARACVMAVHLVNTSFLAAAIALVAWTCTRDADLRFRPRARVEWLVAGALGAVLAVSVTGAVTALGDTLYPVELAQSLTARIAADQTNTASFLERGRAVHPVVAVGAAAFVLFVAARTEKRRASADVSWWAGAVKGLVFAQVSAGVVNIGLGAPGYMQVIHLALATSVWLALVLLYASTVATPEPAG